jgi:hypothetical protein
MALWELKRLRRLYERSPDDSLSECAGRVV